MGEGGDDADGKAAEDEVADDGRGQPRRLLGPLVDEQAQG